MFETAVDTRYKYSGWSTNWSSRGLADSRPESPDPGGALAVANGHHAQHGRQRTLPQTTMPQDLFDNVSLATFDETDDFHP